MPVREVVRRAARAAAALGLATGAGLAPAQSPSEARLQACMACHAAGVAGAPKLGDKAAWAPRIAQGLPTLVNSAIKGKGAMPPKGGSAAPDTEVRAAVEYMVNASK